MVFLAQAQRKGAISYGLAKGQRLPLRSQLLTREDLSPRAFVGTMDDIMEAHEGTGALSPDEDERAVHSSLDYVVQNRQTRLGNYRNRCFANGPFRLWAWVGSFLHGPKLWQKTTPAVMAVLGDTEVVNITTLATLKPLWEQFNDLVQDDASHFLQELVRLSDSSNVIKQYHHVDFRQEVHLREAFPTHLIYPDNEGQEFETLIAKWANTAEGQVLAGEGPWVAQIGRYTHLKGEWTKHHKPLPSSTSQCAMMGTPPKRSSTPWLAFFVTQVMGTKVVISMPSSSTEACTGLWMMVHIPERYQTSRRISSSR